MRAWTFQRPEVAIRPFIHPAVIAMGLHVASARVRRAVRGHRRYPGTAEEILRAGLEDCWSGEHLTASPGTYRQFWTRDTGFAAASLVRLGDPWPARLLSSLAWAMGVWRKRGSHVTTTINPLLRWPVDIFDYGVDSLPLLLSSLQALVAGGGATGEGAAALAHEHRAWIAREVEHFVAEVVDPSTGLVRSDRHFSAHRDTFKNGSTAYANTMVAVLARTVSETGWGPDLLTTYFEAEPPARPQGGGPQGRVTAIDPPLAMPVARIRTATTGLPHARIPPTRITEDGGGRVAGISASDDGPATQITDWGVLLRRHFWQGDRFRDRLGSDETSGEANVWPFFAGLIEDRDMLAAALGTLQREGYTAPYPLRFDATHRVDRLVPAYRLWSADYQTTTSWTSLGSIYLSLLRDVEPGAASAELDRMRALIERDGTFWEVLDARGETWRSRSRLSVSDVSMLWGAILLELLERSVAYTGGGGSGMTIVQ